MQDWEKPGVALLTTLLFLYAWWHELLLALLFIYLLVWMLFAVATRSVTPDQEAQGPERLTTAQMVEHFKAAGYPAKPAGG